MNTTANRSNKLLFYEERKSDQTVSRYVCEFVVSGSDPTDGFIM